MIRVARRRLMVWLGPALTLLAHLWCLGWRVPMHPDGLFQYVEPVLTWRNGAGYRSWEWSRGARSWLLPSLNGALLELADWMRLRPGARLWWVLGAWSLAALPVVARVAQVLGERNPANPRARRAHALGIWLVLGTAPALLVFSAQALSELASAYALVLAYACASDRRWAEGRHASTRLALGLGLWAGLALGLRVSLGPVALLPLLVPLARRRWRALAFACVGALGVVLACGLLDWLTWGRPFQSVVEYVRFNVLEHGADAFGVSSARWYLDTWIAGYGVLACVVVLLANLANLPRTGLWTTGAVVLVAQLSSQPHKEARFVLAALWLSTVPLADGVGRVLAALQRAPRWPRWAGALTISAALVQLCSVGMERASAFHDHSCVPQWGLIDAQIWASEQTDSTGILIEESWYCTAGTLVSGGLPLRGLDGPGERSPLFNYLVVRSPETLHRLTEQGHRVVYHTQGFQVLRRADGPAAP